MNNGTHKISAIFGGMSDRRNTSRFPVNEELTYRVFQSKAVVQTGIGRTINIGSGGLLFTTEEKLQMGRTVEISVNWPARLDGTCALKFVATGRVVRSEDDRAAVQIQRYEFRTRREGAAIPANATPVSVSVAE